MNFRLGTPKAVAVAQGSLAETVAQVGVNGFRHAGVGIKFPLRNGYVYLRQGGGRNPNYTGHGVLPEAAALVYRAVVSGVAFDIYFEQTNTRAR